MQDCIFSVFWHFTPCIWKNAVVEYDSMTQEEKDMKYVKQIGIILGITLAGECLNQFLPLPVPPGVYGLFLPLGTLLTGAMKLESVEGTGNFLMDTMSMMFIPATVGIIECADQLRTVLLPFLLIIAVSTIAVMAVTGKVAQHMVEKKEREQGGR